MKTARRTKIRITPTKPNCSAYIEKIKSVSASGKKLNFSQALSQAFL